MAIEFGGIWPNIQERFKANAFRAANGFCKGFRFEERFSLDESQLLVFRTYFAGYYSQKEGGAIRTALIASSPLIRTALRIPMLSWFADTSIKFDRTYKVVSQELLEQAESLAERLRKGKKTREVGDIESYLLRNAANIITSAIYIEKRNPPDIELLLQNLKLREDKS